MRVAVVWLTRDLRVHDHPALAAACRLAERVVPLFVLDEELLSRSANRSTFLVDCLHDLDRSLRRVGAGLVVRAGPNPVSEVIRVVDEVGASAVFLAADASSRAYRRETVLRASGRRLDVRVFDCHTVIGPDGRRVVLDQAPQRRLASRPRHFDRLLLDGDPANNVGGWQWVAGTGADTRPGRMFNPTLQASRFDPHGDYIRRYVPELAHLPPPFVHEPWRFARTLEAPDHPEPIVNHTEAAAAYRDRLVAARQTCVGGGSA